MENSVVCIPAEAGVDLSAKQYHFGSIASDGQVDPTGDGALADGVIYHPTATVGAPIALAISGVVKVKAGASVTRGVLVASDTNGKCVAAAQSDEILGKALTAAGAEDEFMYVLLKMSGRAPKP